MLAAVKVPVLYTHHFRVVDEKTSPAFEATFGTTGIRRMLR